MARINLEALRKEWEAKNKDYIWKKPLTLCGRTFPQIIKRTNKEGGEQHERKTT